MLQEGGSIQIEQKRSPESTQGAPSKNFQHGVIWCALCVFVTIIVVVLAIVAIDWSDDSTSYATGCDIPFTVVVTSVTNMGQSALGWLHTLKDTWLGSNNQDVTVWDTMYGWTPRTPIPSPMAPPTIMDVKMYMWNNAMDMKITKFCRGTTAECTAGSFQQYEEASTLPKVTKKKGDDQRRNLRKQTIHFHEVSENVENLGMGNTRDADCQEALDAASQVPSYRINDVKLKYWAAAGVEFSMYMTDNRMDMIDTTFQTRTNSVHEDQMTVESDDFPSFGPLTSNRNARVVESSDGVTMYMFKNTLTMDTTIFRMNVNSGSGEELDASLVDIPTMNINMFMCHNSMSMQTTTFAMNVGNNQWPTSSDSIQTDVSNGDSQPLDLVRLVFLNAVYFSETVEPGSSDTGVDFFTWITQKAAGQSTFDINMHMYNNNMVMLNTDFAFNVNQGAATFTATSQGNEDSKQNIVSDSNGCASDSNECRIRDSSKRMTNTIYTMNVGSVDTGYNAAENERVLTVGALNIRMYMFSNSMSMENTDFSANFG